MRTRLEDLNIVLNQTNDHRQRVLHSVARELPNWIVMVQKMKAIYHTMNLFNMDVSKKCLIAECWVPVSDLGILQSCLTEGSVSQRKKYQRNKYKKGEIIIFARRDCVEAQCHHS